MTNTLHRQGSVESLAGDYVIFARPASGINREGAGPRLQTFLRLAKQHRPVNLGNEDFGAATPDQWDDMIAATTDQSGCTATFNDPDRLLAFLADLAEADLGISINISGLVDRVESLGRAVGITRHSMEQSLGFWGATDRLAARPVLEISTMCGHGMVSFNLVAKMIEQVKTGKLSPRQAAALLTRPCVCGAFNPARAEALLARARTVAGQLTGLPGLGPATTGPGHKAAS